MEEVSFFNKKSGSRSFRFFIERKLFIEFFHFFNKFAEEFESGVNGFRTAHIYAGNFKKGDRVGAAAAGKEFFIVFNSGFTFCKDSVCNCNCCGEAGCLLEYIVVIDEMRDSCPFKSDSVIGNHIGSEIEFVEFVVFCGKSICGKSFAAFGHSSDFSFKFSKHGLAVNGSFKGI